jgi:large subunit ribosomal protein L14
MIYPQTILSVADNTGAQKIMCIKVLGANKKYGRIGDSIVGVVKEAIPNMLIKRSTIVEAVIVRTRKSFHRKDGTFINFDDNAVVLINKEYNPRGTRIFGPIAREIRSTKFSKIVSLASEIV